MKTTEELKDRPDNAVSEEKAKKALEAAEKEVEDADVKLGEAELEQVAGGDPMGPDPFFKRPFM